MTTITTSVEVKQPICFVDGNIMQPVGKVGSSISSVELWDDYSSDVVVSRPWNYSRGINSVKPKSLVASPGKYTFSLNNTAQNSGAAAGYYSPDHANIRGGFEQGAEIRIKQATSTGSQYQWRGKIYDITPDATTFVPFTRVLCYDWMKVAQESRFQATTVAADQRADQAIQTMVDTLPVSRKPEAVNLATGKSTFPFVFDSERDEKTSIMTVLQKSAQSELGKVYINGQDGDGENLVFENRHYSASETTVQHDFDDDVVQVRTAYPYDLIKTSFIIRTFPREVDTGDIVLAQIRKSFSVAGGDTRTVKLNFRDPDGGERISAASLAARVSGVDYIANAQENDGGASRTADMTVAENVQSGNSISLDVTNIGTTTFWVTTLQQKGKGIYLYDPATFETESNGTYIAESGERVLRYDLPYEDDYNVGVDFGDYLQSTWEIPICQIDGLTYYPNENAELAQAFLDIDLGHRITVNFTQLGIDQDYFVRKMDVRWDRGLLRCSYGLVPATSTTFFTLNDAVYAKLNDPTAKLAF